MRTVIQHVCHRLLIALLLLSSPLGNGEESGKENAEKSREKSGEKSGEEYSEKSVPNSTDKSRQISFDIPSQNLANSLITLSKQARIPIVFAAEITANKVAPALQKKVTVDQALREILVESGLFYMLLEQRFIVITANPPREADGSLSLDSRYLPGLEQTSIYGHIITGSRLRRSDFEGSMPVDILEQPELELRGAATLAEKLKFLPAVSGNPTSTAVTNGGDGTATVTLRGLPASNTLVLINGRRIAADGLEGDAVNLNAIAPAAIERIEVLKDGASAIYGADAIAGVVNIVMKDDFDGILLETFYGETRRGDLQTSNTNLLWGNNFTWGSAFVSATVYNQESIYSRDRPRSANADGRSWGGADLRSSATPASRITLPDESVVTLNQDPSASYLAGTSPGDFRPVSDEDLYNYAEETTALVPHEHHSIYSSLQLDLDDQLGLFMQASYDKTEADNQLAATPIFTAFETLPLTVAADNRYNPFGVDLEDVRRRLVELPPRRQLNGSTARRATIGLTGIIDRWSWDATYSWSKNDAEEQLTNLVSTVNLQAALGPDALCVAPCVPINLFGAPDSIDANQISFIRTNSRVKGFSKLSSWSANAVGPLAQLPGGTADIATGLEYRLENTSKKSDPLTGSEGTIGGANVVASAGERKVAEAYAETQLPLIYEQGAIKSLILELSVRHSHYSDFGNTTNPKIGVMLRPNNNFLIRSTWSEGFRAPSLNELYKVAAESQAFLVDPCSNPENAAELVGCSQATDPTRLQYLTLFGGNQNLRPEESTNNTLGFVWAPLSTPGFKSSLDFFRIKQTNVVDANAQNIVDLNAQTGLLDQLVIRNDDGEIERILARNINIGERLIEGFDISGRYQPESGPLGRFAFALNAAHIMKYINQANPRAPKVDVSGTFVDDASDGLGSIPEWKGNVGLMWRKQAWQGSYTVHYISSLTETVPMTEQRRHIASWVTHEVQLGYTFKVAEGLRVLAGVDNLFDRPPPRVASAFNDNIDSRTHELKGRFLYLKLSQKI